MRKLFITFTIALLIIPTIAFAQEGPAKALREALNAKLSPSIEAPQAKSTVPQPEAAIIAYDYGLIFSYQASTDWWWTGLAIRNSTQPNNITVRLIDGNGILRGEGTFTISAFNEQRIGLLSDMIGAGYVPQVGSVYVYGTDYFSATLFVGIGDVGFGFFEKDAMNF